MLIFYVFHFHYVFFSLFSLFSQFYLTPWLYCCDVVQNKIKKQKFRGWGVKIYKNIYYESFNVIFYVLFFYNKNVFKKNVI